MGSPRDYSIQAGLDKVGSAYYAAATDITFRSAQRSDFDVINRYTDRLIDAMKRRDDRLFWKGQPIVRECFGNADPDRQVEGWSLYRGYAVTSDPSHRWHLHISFFRAFVNNWDAVSRVLDVLLDRQPPPPEPEIDEEGDDDMKLSDKVKLKGEWAGEVLGMNEVSVDGALGYAAASAFLTRDVLDKLDEQNRILAEIRDSLRVLTSDGASEEAAGAPDVGSGQSRS